MESASPVPTTRAPSVKTLLSLWARAIRAEKTSWHSAARTPLTLLAEIATPIPVPHIIIQIKLFSPSYDRSDQGNPPNVEKNAKIAP